MAILIVAVFPSRLSRYRRRLHAAKSLIFQTAEPENLEEIIHLSLGY
jgi:hypothetical protein